MHDVDHTNEESIMFVLAISKSQKVPTRKIYSVLVMPLSRKDLLYRFAFVLVMRPRESQRNPERPREDQRGQKRPEKPREAESDPERPREAQ